MLLSYCHFHFVYEPLLSPEDFVLYDGALLVLRFAPGCLVERFLLSCGRLFSLAFLPVWPAQWHLGIQMCLS